MNWRKSITISFLPLLAFMSFILIDKKEENKEDTARKVASVPVSKKYAEPLRKPVPLRTVAALQGDKNQHSFLKNRIPQSVESTFEKDPSIKLNKGYEFIKDVAGIPKKDYSPSMGEIIHERDGFVFFKSSPGHSYNPVAISRFTNNLYTISSVLHIKGATHNLRDSLLAEGYTEYYYHAPLKFLSIKSEPGQLMKVYSELREKGFKVELEVLKPPHKTI